MRAAGYHFSFAKATEGASHVDPRFHENWEEMKRTGILRGAYHFFHPDQDAGEQAKHFLSVVGLEAGDLPPVLDVELAEGLEPSAVREAVRAWLRHVESSLGVRPIVYSNLSFLDDELTPIVGRFPLWVAEYTDTPPGDVAPGKPWTFWQHSQDGSVDGIDGAVDLSVFAGTLDQLERLLVKPRRSQRTAD